MRDLRRPSGRGRLTLSLSDSNHAERPRKRTRCAPPLTRFARKAGTRSAAHAPDPDVASALRRRDPGDPLARNPEEDEAARHDMAIRPRLPRRRPGDAVREPEDLADLGAREAVEGA